MIHPTGRLGHSDKNSHSVLLSCTTNVESAGIAASHGLNKPRPMRLKKTKQDIEDIDYQ